MCRFIFFVSFSLLSLSSCATKKNTLVETTLQLESGKFEHFRTEVENKLAAFGFRENEIIKDVAADKLTIKSKINLKDLDTYTPIMNPSNLDFWLAYRIDDDEFRTVDFSSIDIEGFRLTIPNAYQVYPISVFGVCEDESMLDNITLKLQKGVKGLPKSKWIWSKNKTDAHKRVFFLYLVKTNGEDDAPLTEENISQSNISNNEYTGEPMVNIAFDHRGAKIWADMTTKAAQDNNRCIAMVYNDRVWSCPRVNKPIYSGRSALVGDFKEEQALEISNSLNVKRYKYKFKVLSQNVKEL